MRSSSYLLAASGLALLLAACGPSKRPPPRQWSAQAQPGPQAAPPSYAMPWMVPVPQGVTPAAAPTVAPAAAPSSRGEEDRCLSDAGTAADCEAALGAIASASPAAGPAAPGRIHDVYRKACEKKAKLLGCAVFKSTAVDAGDKPQVELLMLCEGGRSEACEDVDTKKAPLVAWSSTLKAEHCKKGEQALCKSYRACKGASEWGCRPAASANPPVEVCGCVPRQCSGPLTVTPMARTWADGTARGAFRCAP